MSTSLILQLYEIKAVKFGDFLLKSGIKSPVYFDLRVLVSHPSILEKVSEELWQSSQRGHADFKSVCGVPYTALPMATLMSVRHNVPMLMKRREAKNHGTKKLIEGEITKGTSCLIVEDVVTSGGSVLETAEALWEAGLTVKDAVVFLDREQMGKERLAAKGIKLHSVFTVSDILTALESQGKITPAKVAEVKSFIKANQFPVVTTPTHPKIWSHEERESLVQHPLTKRLLKIMSKKKTNLVFSADLTSSEALLKAVNLVGPYICMVKTHVDIITDWSTDWSASLKSLADQHEFLIFEDRKFCDIGNTVQSQYGGGMYGICEWADVVNSHALPGPGIVEGLKKVALSRERGCLLIAEMSSKGNLLSTSYTKETVELGKRHADFIIGFISLHRLTDDPTFLHFTPGVHLASEGDNMGQQYLTPEEVIKNRKSDLVIVGRGIYQSVDPSATARKYQEAAYKAYEESLKL